MQKNIWKRIAEDTASLRARIDEVQENVEFDRADTFSTLSVLSRTSGSAIGAWGDSITLGAGSTIGTGTDWYSRLQSLLTGVMSPTRSGNQGVTGNTSAQVLARMTPELIASYDIGLVNVGANDAGQLVPQAQFEANIKAIKAAHDAQGKPVVFGEVTPRGEDPDTTTAIVKRINAYNLFLRFWTALNGVPLVPTHRLLVDPLSGYMKTSYWTSPDETHPNSAGHLVMAQSFADVLRPLLPTPYWPVVTRGGGLMPEPLFAGAGGWGNYAGPAFPSISYVAAANNDLPAGRWMRFTAAAGEAGTMGAPIPNWSPGDRLLLMMKARSSYPAALAKVQLMNQDQVARVIALDSPPTVGPHSLVFDYRVPTSNPPTQLHWGVRVQADSGAATVDIGACDVFNLTTMNMDGLKI